ncbi:hypothetical protein BAE44_0008325 [Dichanthelium oligosanthes]|uniref:PGG domain-containing protein n=1 Tax=Dichanthelium oligosanthes TaxID=888268 RepID=A0A1E5W020_9POAL|nr:hypothetical protein BAE44_0008325 [Dichanthelium oligosanthes]
MEDRQQQQYIQLARPPSHDGSPAKATTAPAMQQPNEADAARLVQMCPSLYRAVHRGRTEEVMALLLQQHGAATDYQATGNDSSQLLLCFPSITVHGQCDTLEVTAERNTVLHVAAEQGHDELIRELNLRFREPGLLSRQNSALDTPLHCAARAGHVRAVTVLVQLAQDCGESILGCKNEAGDTALHLAARYGHGTVVEVLVWAAEGPAAELNGDGVSPLYLARIRTNELRISLPAEMVHLLLEWRPALTDQVDSSGSSPLHFAASHGDRTIVHAILRAGPPGTVYKKDSCGLSALHVAARMGHHRVVKDMLGTCPAAADLRDDDGGTFVHAAAREKRSSVVSLAVKNPMLRGLLNSRDRDGNTPLHLAVAVGAPGVVEALLRKGKVRADVLNKDGYTALDLAGRQTSFFTMVNLVVTLAAFGAQLRPQRQDHMKPWSGGDVRQWIEKMSDPLVVVAGLIVAAALTAGFNLPGSYDGSGKANLVGKGNAFKFFLILDTLAVATSMVAVTLLVYGKVSRSADSWKSFAAALQFMWASLISLMLAFYVALVATKATYQSVQVAIYAFISVLNFCITVWIAPAKRWRTICRFLRQCLCRCHSKGKHVVIKRQYPFAGASVINFCLFTVIGMVALGSLQAIFAVYRREGISSSSPAPSPL